MLQISQNWICSVHSWTFIANFDWVVLKGDFGFAWVLCDYMWFQPEQTLLWWKAALMNLSKFLLQLAFQNQLSSYHKWSSISSVKRPKGTLIENRHPLIFQLYVTYISLISNKRMIIEWYQTWKSHIWIVTIFLIRGCRFSNMKRLLSIHL